MAADLRVILIKLADRLHNMRTLSALPPQKQKRIALETMEIYAPLAYRLGMQRVSGELEDLAFPYLYPNEYKWLEVNVQYRYEELEKYLKKLKPIVENALYDAGIKPITIDFRAKRYSSLYKKLLKYEMDLDKIYDLVAFRIIVKNVEDCYTALGIIHKLWPPLPGRIKDYIALPKPNGYRSLHTTIIGPEQKIIEFQIRTEEMHNVAENGIAAHWAYEERKGTKDYARNRTPVADSKEMAWVEQLRSWQKEFTDPQEFLDSFKVDFFKERIFALTPKGEVVDLPLGATPVDFAYQIHSQLGDQCVGAKVNGKIVPLDYKLKPQDVVEIITQKGKKPSPSWLNFVISPGAKHHIKSAIRKSAGPGSILRDNKKYTELKVVALDRVGLMKDVSGIISRSHINIESITSRPETHGKFQVMKFKCETADKDKVWKVILKLKNLPEVKEIDYRFL
ncbi:MAG: TGS domain-containing protein [Nitrosarchaeum sp.]|nr:TGS domain-containing protein [Nitrosarchaeum sp.]